MDKELSEILMGITQSFNAQLLVANAKQKALEDAVSQLYSDHGRSDFEKIYKHNFAVELEQISGEYLNSLPPRIVSLIEQLQSRYKIPDRS